jgi:hypothetical protein
MGAREEPIQMLMHPIDRGLSHQLRRPDMLSKFVAAKDVVLNTSRFYEHQRSLSHLTSLSDSEEQDITLTMISGSNSCIAGTSTQTRIMHPRLQM